MNTKVQFPILIDRTLSEESPQSAESQLGGADVHFGVGQSSLRFNASYSPLSTIRFTWSIRIHKKVYKVLLGTSGLFGGKGQTYPNIDTNLDPSIDNVNNLLGGNVTHDINKTFGDLSLPSGG